MQAALVAARRGARLSGVALRVVAAPGEVDAGAQRAAHVADTRVEALQHDRAQGRQIGAVKQELLLQLALACSAHVGQARLSVNAASPDTLTCAQLLTHDLTADGRLHSFVHCEFPRQWRGGRVQPRIVMLLTAHPVHPTECSRQTVTRPEAACVLSCNLQLMLLQSLRNAL